MASLYIGNLDYVVEESDIYNLFREFDVRAVHMKFTYCFVTFGDRDQARLATALDGTELFERRIKVEWARSNYDPGGIFNAQIRYQNLSNSASSLASSASNQSSVSSSLPPLVASIQNNALSNLMPVTENTLLECEICFVRFDYNVHRPRSLPCGHSLCSLCITDTFKANEDSGNDCLLCPFCRTSCGPYKRRVGQFPETFFILKMLEVESEKAKGNGESQEKEKDIEEKRKKKEKKKEQEEEYLKFQKQIGLDSTVSGIISCKDHLEGLEDLHKEQFSMKKKLKTQRKRLLEEVIQIESEIMELSEQMFNIEVWIASGKNLLTKFDNIQENFSKVSEEDKESIESSYEAAERCCLATQRWSDGSMPDINKMNLFVEKKKKKKQENEEVVELSEALGELNRLSDTSVEGASLVLSASGSSQSLRPPHRKILKKSKLGVKVGVNTFDAVPEDVTDIDSGFEIMVSDKPGPVKRNKSTGDNFTTEMSSDRTKLIIRNPSTRDNNISESTTRTSVPFVVTSTPHSFNFGSTSNPFQTNVCTSTEAALFSTTTATLPMNLSSSVTSVLGLENSNTITRTSANMNLFSNASSAGPLFSSCKTSTVSTSFSMGNLSHPSTNGSSNTSTSVAEAAKQTSSEEFSIRNYFPSASVRPKVNSGFDQTETLFQTSPTFPNSSDDLSKSESSLDSTNIARASTFVEHADLRKKLNVAFKSLFPEFRLDSSNASANSVNTTDFTTNTTTTTTNSIGASTSVCKSMTLVSPSSSHSSLGSVFKARDVGDMNFSSSSPVSTLIAENTLVTTAQTSNVANPVFTASSQFSFPSAASSTYNKSSNENSFTFSKAITQANEIFTMKRSPTSSASVRPRIPKSLSPTNLVDNTDSIFIKDGNLSGKSSCDNESMKSLPSFSFTMSPGKFSGISFAPSTTTETKTATNSNNAGFSFPQSACSTTAPKASNFNLGPFEKPISFNLKPKNFNFSLAEATKKVNFSNHKNDKNSNFDESDYDST